MRTMIRAALQSSALNPLHLSSWSVSRKEVKIESSFVAILSALAKLYSQPIQERLAGQQQMPCGPFALLRQDRRVLRARSCLGQSACKDAFLLPSLVVCLCNLGAI